MYSFRPTKLLSKFQLSKSTFLYLRTINKVFCHLFAVLPNSS